MIDNKIIIKKWNEDDMEKVGFFDESGNFHMLKGLAKDFRKPCIKVINVENGDYAEILVEDLI